MDESIADFFDNRSVFITGGTGFMGKVLIEKLLRSCPGIWKIYVLLRPSKDGYSVEEKLKKVFSSQLFDRLRKEKSEEQIFEKVYPIQGDIRKLGLGISHEDKKLITENVSVVFHVAASVRFDDPINDAIIINTRGTREVVTLAKQIKNIAVLLHVSTTYSNCYRKTVDEIIYPAPLNWKEAIFMAENGDPVVMNILSQKYLGEYPNSYVLTKNLAEHVLNDERENLPIVIFRPSIVISSDREPMPGWIDNFNGPVGFMVGIGKGVVRVSFTNKETRPDYIPVDISIKGMIVAAWKKAVEKKESKNEIAVLNSASGYKSVTMTELVDLGQQFSYQYPPADTLWIPDIMFTSNSTCFYVNVILKQILPAILVDQFLSFAKKKPLHLLRIQRKIFRASMELSYFTSNQWTFLNQNFLNLRHSIPDKDKESFHFIIEDIHPEEYLKNAIIGGHKYLLNSDVTALPSAANRLKRLRILRALIRFTFWSFIVWYLYKNFPSAIEVF